MSRARADIAPSTLLAANLVSTALAGLTSKLATLERDNAQSAARVAELEARLAAQQQRRPVEVERERAQERDGAAQEREQQARRLRREVETMLGEERDRRAGASAFRSSFRLSPSSRRAMTD